MLTPVRENDPEFVSLQESGLRQKKIRFWCGLEKDRE